MPKVVMIPSFLTKKPRRGGLLSLTLLLTATFIQASTRRSTPTFCSSTSTTSNAAFNNNINVLRKRKTISYVLSSSSLMVEKITSYNQPHRTTTTKQLYTPSVLRLTQDNDDNEPLPNTYDGLGSGKVILTLVVGVCIWLFSIPPEFRRAYICPAEIYCYQDPTVCEDCTTWNQWFTDIGDYYRKGGGIQFDFSIDPKTLEKNQNKLNSMGFGK